MSGGAPRLFALTGPEALELARSRGTPCFAYRLDIARSRWDELRAALPPRAVLAYAVKANPGSELVAALAERGAWLDCASKGELELARSSGLKGPRLLFAGPGKSGEELRLALSLGARVQADGIEDLSRLDALLAERDALAETISPPLRVSLRVHPLSGVSEDSPIIGGSGPSAFGIDEEDLPGFVEEASRFTRVRIAGLQVFAASNERSAGRLLDNHRAAFAIGERLQALRGGELDLIDLGGGLGIPYAEDEDELDIREFGSGLSALLEANPWFAGRIVVEPGRWLAGPCGVYLARVIRVKSSRGALFAVLEGGANHLLRPLLTGQAFPAAAPRARGAVEAPAVEQILAGPLCTSLDRLGAVLLPRLEAGDLVMLGQAGAYGSTEAMTAFLSHPPAEEYWLDGPPRA